MAEEIQRLQQKNAELEQTMNTMLETLRELTLKTKKGESSNMQLSTTPIPAPESFSGKKDDWENWAKHYERYRHATNMELQPAIAQINNLLLFMGTHVNVTLDAMKKRESDFETYEEAKAAFDEYYKKKINIIYERAKFNQRTQRTDEAANDYIATLQSMAKKLSYGGLLDELVRDRLVVGITDSKLSEHLQMDENLTLETAKNKILQAEMVKAQAKELRDKPEVAKIEKIDRKRKFKKKSHKFESKNKEKCSRCGNESHETIRDCPAFKYVCKKCNIRGHFTKYCKTKKIQKIEEHNEVSSSEESNESSNNTSDDDESYDEYWLPAIHRVCEVKKCQPWMVTLFHKGVPVNFKIDTGADESVVSTTTAKLLKITNELKPSNAILMGPGKGGDRKLTVHGVAKIAVSVGRSEKETKNIRIFVVDTVENLLGRPAIEKLKLLQWKRIDTVKNESLMTKENVAGEFPNLFGGLGKVKDVSHRIKIKSNAEPFAVNAPRRVPLPLMEKTKTELDQMEKKGVIEKIEKPTEWCAPMVVVGKANGKVRICTDFTELNKSVIRERQMLPSVDETLAQLKQSKFFSKLDCSNGFWQIELDERCQHLTTFITPFGRYKYNRLPFGITSAPEVFSRVIMNLLGNIPGVKVHVDDVAVTGKTVKEHNENLRKVLKILQDNGIVLNYEKCIIGDTSINYLGYILDQSGIRPDPQTIKAIVEFHAPRNVTEVRQFLGMFNYITKFVPKSADRTKHLRHLLQKSTEFCWTSSHQKEFDELKQTLTTEPVIAYYDVNRDTRITTDASSYGIAGVLEQNHGDNWRPVYYCSKALNDTEKSYAQIEKEALAVTWCCERLQQFLLGKPFTVRTDHKPLLTCLKTKAISDLTARLQRLRMRLMIFDYEMVFVPGKEIFTADVLSRAPIQTTEKSPDILSDSHMKMFIHAINATMNNELNVGEEEIRTAQEDDEVIQKLKRYVENDWLPKSRCEKETLPYYKHRADLTTFKGLLCYKTRLLIPKQLRQKCLEGVHIGHQGINSCRNIAKTTMWWPLMNQHIKDMVENCETCIKNSSNHCEPLQTSPTPEKPWQTVGADLCEVTPRGAKSKSTFLVVQDYYSKYPEVARVKNITSTEIINRLKDTFARHGIPHTLRTDNGTQFTSKEFKCFQQQYKFRWITSSPLHSQSNGLAESGVKTVKRILKKCSDPFLGLLAYRNTPLPNGYSPSQLLNGRTMRDLLPRLESKLKPSAVNHRQVYKQLLEEKRQQKRNYDERHAVRDLKPLKNQQLVWLIDRREEGHVIGKCNEPRSYNVGTSTGVYRRNRRYLKILPRESRTSTSLTPVPTPTAESSSNQTIEQNQQAFRPSNGQTVEENGQAHSTETRLGQNKRRRKVDEHVPNAPLRKSARNANKRVDYRPYL